MPLNLCSDTHTVSFALRRIMHPFGNFIPSDPKRTPIPPSKRIYRQNHTQKFAWFSGYLESVEMIGGLRFTLLPPQRTTRMSLFSTMFFCLCSHHMWPLCVSSSPVVKPNHRVTAPARGRAATTRFSHYYYRKEYKIVKAKDYRIPLKRLC